MLRRLLSSVYYIRALHGLQRGDYPRSIVYLSKALRFRPDNAFAYCNRGFAQQAMGDHRRADLDLSRAIGLNPKLAMAYYNRGISAKCLGQYDRAIADQRQAVSLDPKHANAYGELGIAYLCEFEYDLAIANLTKAINLDPKNASHSKHRGLARFYRGDFAACAADLRQCVDLENDPYAMLFCFVARSRLGENAIDQLEADARKLKEGAWPAAIISHYLGKSRTPDTVIAAASDRDEGCEVHFYLGQWYLLGDNRADAIKAFQEAVRACPTYFVEYIGAIAELTRLGCGGKSG
jgi:lipoprotein NlpI